MTNAENSAGTAVIGRPFQPGESGNPGGRPKGLTRRVQELVGDNGEAIASFMFEIMNDESARNADRIEAAKWLGDRGFGRPVQALDVGVNQVTIGDLFQGFSSEDLDALIAIYDKYSVIEAVESGNVSRVAPAVPSRRR